MSHLSAVLQGAAVGRLAGPHVLNKGVQIEVERHGGFIYGEDTGRISDKLFNLTYFTRFAFGVFQVSPYRPVYVCCQKNSEKQGIKIS